MADFKVRQYKMKGLVMEETKINYYFEHTEEFSFNEIFKDCTYPWEVLAKTKNFLKQKVQDKNLKVNLAKTGENTVITGNYFIDEGTTIAPNVVIEGPVLIGKNVTISSGALIRPGSIIGDNASVGHGSEIKNSILQNKSKVASLAFVGDSILGKSTRIGSGVIIANRRFDQQNIVLKINGEKFETNTDFFGAIIGDCSRIGANAATLPGTCIGAYTWILPTLQIRGFIPSEKILFPEEKYRIMDNPKTELK